MKKPATKAPDSNNTSYDVRTIVAGDLDKEARAACIAVIKKGGAVDTDSAARELSRASSLAIAHKGNEIVGVAAIKRPRPGYAATISTKSGVTFPPETLELGYVAVDPDHQGSPFITSPCRRLGSAASGPVVRDDG